MSSTTFLQGIHDSIQQATAKTKSKAFQTLSATNLSGDNESSSYSATSTTSNLDIGKSTNQRNHTATAGVLGTAASSITSISDQMPPAADKNGNEDDHDSDKSSVLSDLSRTPTPPTQALRKVDYHYARYEIECKHLDWCDCPMHSAYESGKRIPHLSEWALGATVWPVSNVRQTAGEEMMR